MSIDWSEPIKSEMERRLSEPSIGEKLKEQGISIQNDDGSYKSPMDILHELRVAYYKDIVDDFAEVETITLGEPVIVGFDLSNGEDFAIRRLGKWIVDGDNNDR